jgi:hypothetical protein
MEYQTPTIEIIRFTTEDVITTSSVDPLELPLVSDSTD